MIIASLMGTTSAFASSKRIEKLDKRIFKQSSLNVRYSNLYYFHLSEEELLETQGKTFPVALGLLVSPRKEVDGFVRISTTCTSSLRAHADAKSKANLMIGNSIHVQRGNQPLFGELGRRLITAFDSEGAYTIALPIDILQFAVYEAAMEHDWDVVRKRIDGEELTPKNSKHAFYSYLSPIAYENHFANETKIVKKRARTAKSKKDEKVKAHEKAKVITGNTIGKVTSFILLSGASVYGMLAAIDYFNIPSRILFQSSPVLEKTLEVKRFAMERVIPGIKKRLPSFEEISSSSLEQQSLTPKIQPRLR